MKTLRNFAIISLAIVAYHVDIHTLSCPKAQVKRGNHCITESRAREDRAKEHAVTNQINQLVNLQTIEKEKEDLSNSVRVFIGNPTQATNQAILDALNKLAATISQIQANVPQLLNAFTANHQAGSAPVVAQNNAPVAPVVAAAPATSGSTNAAPTQPAAPVVSPTQSSTPSATSTGNNNSTTAGTGDQSSDTTAGTSSTDNGSGSTSSSDGSSNDISTDPFGDDSSNSSGSSSNGMSNS